MKRGQTHSATPSRPEAAIVNPGGAAPAPTQGKPERVDAGGRPGFRFWGTQPADGLCLVDGWNFRLLV
jgi:hypothetical protein